MAETHFLIDGYAAFHRAYHAIRGPMHSPLTGEPTNLVYGFTAMLLKLLREQKPDHLVVVIDASGDQGTFRSQIYPEYKAHRDPLPEDFKPQVERCLELLRDLGIPIVAEEGVEADDSIASLVATLRRERPEDSIRIVSRDKDLSQLIDEKTALFDPQKDEFVDLEKIFGRPGLQPRQVPDVLALMGDPVDNVPGVKGVGPKTAAELLLKFGTLDELLERADEIPGKRGEAIREAKDSIPLARRLVELKHDLQIELDPEASRGDLRRADRDKSIELLRTMGFGRLREDLAKLLAHELPPDDERGASVKAVSPDADAGLFAQGGLFDDAPSTSAEEAVFTTPAEIVRDAASLATLADRIRAAAAAGEPIALDLETTGLAIHGAELCGIAIAFDGESGLYVPVRSPEPGSHLDGQAVIEALRSPLEDPATILIGHNLKFDLAMLRRAGVVPQGAVIDTMIESHLADPGDAGHGLKDVAERLLGVRPRRIATLIGEGRDQRSFAEVPLAEAAPYAVQDVVLAWRVHERLRSRIESMGLAELCREVEFPLGAWAASDSARQVGAEHRLGDP
jgi:DNA polymerase-1